MANTRKIGVNLKIKCKISFVYNPTNRCKLWYGEKEEGTKKNADDFRLNNAIFVRFFLIKYMNFQLKHKVYLNTVHSCSGSCYFSLFFFFFCFEFLFRFFFFHSFVSMLFAFSWPHAIVRNFRIFISPAARLISLLKLVLLLKIRAATNNAVRLCSFKYLIDSGALVRLI